ncbi:unnamed protein product [Anisakis simplex]|uniref:Uncharacterized protein n=1 Tax=Anisakis simplex TaxID=6269 RepID=A0A3P6RB19_ANISI|nr:unnamed protein product [Anisakis simplex]
MICLDDLLAWQPTDNWSTDVDKIIDDKSDVTVERVSPSKKSRCSRGERKENLLHVPKPSPAPATISNSFKKELCDAYEMCAAAICSFAECRNGLECEQILQFVEEFGDVQQFVSESLLFKCKFDEAIGQLNERLERLNDNGANSSTNASEGNAHESSASNDGVQNLKDVKTRSKEKRKEREIKKEIEEPPSETSVVTSKSPSETEAIKKESEIVYLQLACANAIARN